MVGQVGNFLERRVTCSRTFLAWHSRQATRRSERTRSPGRVWAAIRCATCSIPPAAVSFCFPEPCPALRSVMNMASVLR